MKHCTVDISKCNKVQNIYTQIWNKELKLSKASETFICLYVKNEQLEIDILGRNHFQ